MSQEASFPAAEKELQLSMSKTVDLYYFLLNLCPALKRVAAEKIETGRNKFNPSESEINASTRFVDNRFISLLEADGNFCRLCEKKGFGWGEYDVFVKKLYASIAASDYYQDYISSEEDSFAADCRFISRIFEEELEDNEMLWDILEESSVYWVDDLGYVLNVIIRDLAQQSPGGAVPVHQVFLKDDDRAFASGLLAAAIGGYDEYLKVVQDNVPNWDPERIVRTDACLMVLGIAEAVRFPTIPIKVTINEYVEISKFYSTPNSHGFVNGLLDVILKNMLASGEIVKQGRGLYNGENN